MTFVEDIWRNDTLRETAGESGIFFSSSYYQEKERRAHRLSSQIVKEIVRTASEISTYGYGRIWSMIRINGTKVNRKNFGRAIRYRSQSLPSVKHIDRTKHWNLFSPTEQGMTYLMTINDCLTKEWAGY
jgi:hypothetical protein